jgi:hypothetical protein
VINALPKVVAAPPGMRTMRDIPLIHHLNPIELKASLRRRR